MNYTSLIFLLFINLHSLVNTVQEARRFVVVAACVSCCLCVFGFADSREETVLGSIPLPSYVIAPVEPDDHINRKFAFKVTLKCQEELTSACIAVSERLSSYG